ncbi:Inositolphosphorylceramide-B hydroxylase [Myriangium duriaei CBS 260.36]|uniref:Ceramide very long chain fatty acid hydroxylase n=1 Tax=Myriangium duriaei CBS 260.36 TaxID=1168546 RepID=A0A9P4J657_9PEZI|nr:Inositolphosphorylceramide-B hydroxylase [Myriangium duriaei CBS 260.36]
MPGRTLPTLPVADVQMKNTSKACYVTIGTRVFDVTTFLDDHPGGGDLILEYGGKDVTEIMGDEVSHGHSEAAYEMLDEYHIGFVADSTVIDTVTKSNRPHHIVPFPPTADGEQELERDGNITQEDKVVYATTGMSCAEDLSRDTDVQDDYKKHKFLDLDRPLIPQMWTAGFSKEFYLEQVHRPRHYKGGASAPLFGNFLEPLTKTAWWVVPLIWIPTVTYFAYLASKELSILSLAGHLLFGLFFWTIAEYGLHRSIFHADDYLPDNRVGITLHFLLHGVHHYLPMDRYRLVLPPTLLVILATPFYHLAHLVFSHQWECAVAVFCGGIYGYIWYDMTHYFLHHRNLPPLWRGLKKYHLQHHFADYNNGFGVSNRFWDIVFGTELAPPKVMKVK